MTAATRRATPAEAVTSLLWASRWQGTGIRLLAIARHAAGNRMSLFVFVKNLGARRFYERHGFTAVEESDGSRNEEGEPDVRYEWRTAKSSAGSP